MCVAMFTKRQDFVNSSTTRSNQDYVNVNWSTGVWSHHLRTRPTTLIISIFKTECGDSLGRNISIGYTTLRGARFLGFVDVLNLDVCELENQLVYYLPLLFHFYLDFSTVCILQMWLCCLFYYLLCIKTAKGLYNYVFATNIFKTLQWCKLHV